MPSAPIHGLGFTAERANLIALVERLHVAGLPDRTGQLAALLPVMFDWRAWEHTHQLALDAARQATALRSLGDTYRYQGCLAEAIDAFSSALAVFQAGDDTRSVAGVLNGMADAYRGMPRWDEARAAFETCIGTYHDLDDRLEEARAKIRFALVFRDQRLGEQALSLIAEGLKAVRDLGDRRGGPDRPGPAGIERAWSVLLVFGRG